mgnify:CR=1 FL=1
MELSNTLKKHYPFEGKTIDLNGHKYHYLDEGTGPVIVMVHGNPTWSFYYRNLILGLRDKFRVIVPDHMGCGLSDKPQDYDYTLERRISDLNQLLSNLNIEDYNMVVHDWGGAIGFGNVVSNGLDKLNKVVILNTAAFVSKSIPPSINFLRNKLWGPFAIRALNGFCFPATFMCTEKKLEQEIKQAYLYPYNSYENRIAVSEFVQDIPMEKNHRSFDTLKNIEEKLKLIKAEKLILWGGKDFCFNDHFYYRWKSLFPEAKYKYFENAGHYVLEDKAEECLKEIRSFMLG